MIIVPSPASGSGRSTGPLAFLFTDIESSCQRWEEDAETMARDLGRHDELLRSAVESGEGRVFGHTGDGLCAVFPRPSVALTAAVAAQRALLKERWISPRPLRVRMGIHTGSAAARGNNYFGPTVNRSARLMSLASGGQVICSEAAGLLAKNEVPPEIGLLDLGEHELAGLSHPERVYQVTHPDLPSRFPPLRSQQTRRRLPEAPTAFVGRDRELQELHALLGEWRLVTLTGVGGVGKTRLALEVADRSRDRFPDGVFFVELGALRDPALVPDEVAAALGVLTTGIGGGQVEERLGEYLETRRLLLVLDNCEHLLEATAGLVQAVLARCPGVRVIATSRQVLGVPDEVSWTVPPLSVPPETARVEELAGSDAVALFCQRARTAQPGFALGPANAPAVARICRSLDGIPLALELAAARIRVLGAQQLAERLDRRLHLLTGGTDEAVARHQTLRAAIDWSWDLLSDAERAVLRRLSVFPGSFHLDAAEAVMADGPAGAEFGVLDVISALFDKSLVVVQAGDEEVRYRLLETVRQYAAEKLAGAGETAAAECCHRDYFLALADDWHRGAPAGYWSAGGWAQRVGIEHDNFLAAIEWSLDHGDDDAAVRMGAAMWLYWHWAGRLEASHWLERALSPGRAADPVQVEALTGLGFMLSLSAPEGPGRDKAESLLREAVRLAEQLGNQLAAARSRFYLANVALVRGDRAEERQLVVEALDTFFAMGFAPGVGWCHYGLGWVATAESDLELARFHFERALALWRKEELSELLGVHVMAGLAPLVAANGQAERGRRLAEEAVVIARRLSLPGVLAMALARATETAIWRGDPFWGSTLLVELLALLRRLGARQWVADALEATAVVLEGDGQAAAAACVLGTARSLRELVGEAEGGRRALSEVVSRSRDRLVGTLGSSGFAEHEAIGRFMPVGEAISYALGRLSSEAQPSVLTR